MTDVSTSTQNEFANYFRERVAEEHLDIPRQLMQESQYYDYSMHISLNSNLSRRYESIHRCAVGIAYHDGCVLVVDEPKRGLTIPGGHVEFLEATRVAVKREMLEETAYQAPATLWAAPVATVLLPIRGCVTYLIDVFVGQDETLFKHQLRDNARIVEWTHWFDRQCNRVQAPLVLACAICDPGFGHHCIEYGLVTRLANAVATYIKDLNIVINRIK